MQSRNAKKLSREEQMTLDLSVAKTSYDKLEVASKHGIIGLARELIRSGVPVNPDPAKFTDTPLYFAAIHNQLEMVNLLIDEGAYVNQPSRMSLGETPLEGSISYGNLEIFNTLLKRGADANHINSDTENTLLHVAVGLAESKFDIALIMINKLIELGVYLHSKNSFGETPFDIAKKNKHVWKILNNEETSAKNFSILRSVLSQSNIIERESNFKCGKALAKLGKFAQVDALDNPIPPLQSSLNGCVGFKKRK